MSFEICEECTVGELNTSTGEELTRQVLSEYFHPTQDKDETYIRLVESLSARESEAVAGCLCLRRLGICKLVTQEAV